MTLFGIPFGLSGLATAWAYAAKHDLAAPGIRDGLSILGAVVWLIVLILYARGAGRRPWRAISADLTDPVLGPFAALALVAPLVLTVVGLLPHAPSLARTIITILIAAIVALGGWFTGQWIYGPLSIEKLHPGYFLPTAAGGLLAATAAGTSGYTKLGYALFGLGMICWLILGSMILARLFFWPALPDPLTPSIAIEVAPAAVATVAYLTLRHDHIDAFAAALSGYGLLMVLAQLPLLPTYRRLKFAPSFWAFTFSWAAVATAGLHWLADTHPAYWRTYTYAVLVAISLLVFLIATRTIAAVARRQLLPPAHTRDNGAAIEYPTDPAQVTA